MNSKEVKDKWPVAYFRSEHLAKEGDNAVSTTKKIKAEFGLTHEESKRIVCAVFKNVSLEEHQENICNQILDIEAKNKF